MEEDISSVALAIDCTFPAASFDALATVVVA
jgi:hypothetical protein